MAKFGKKEKKATTASSKAAGKVAPPKQSKQPKPPKPSVAPDIYTVMLGLSALFLIMAVVVLGLNFYWYQTTDPAVVPLNTWAR